MPQFEYFEMHILNPLANPNWKIDAHTEQTSSPPLPQFDIVNHGETTFGILPSQHGVGVVGGGGGVINKRKIIL